MGSNLKRRAGGARQGLNASEADEARQAREYSRSDRDSQFAVPDDFGGVLARLKRANRLLNDLELLAGRSHLYSVPTHLVVDLAVMCNFKCTMCHHSKLKFTSSRLNGSEIHKIIDVLPYLETVEVAGLGEPLLVPQLNNFLRVAKLFDCQVTLFTNGLLIARRLDVFAHLYRVNVSFDGAKASTFEALRSGANFKRIVASVTKLRERYPALRIGFSTVVSNYNVGEIAGIVKLATELGVAEVNLSPVTHTPALALCVDDRPLFEQQMDEARRLAAQHGIDLHCDVGQQDFNSAADRKPFTSSSPRVRERSRNMRVVDLRQGNHGETWDGRLHRSLADVRDELLRSATKIEGLVDELTADLARQGSDFAEPYCSAPWKMMFAQNDGNARLCCYSELPVGRMQSGVLSSYNTVVLEGIRGSLAQGKPTLEVCRVCTDTHRVLGMAGAHDTREKLGFGIATASNAYARQKPSELARRNGSSRSAGTTTQESNSRPRGRALPIVTEPSTQTFHPVTHASHSTLAGAASPAPPGFCAAPWVETVIRIDGNVLPCCRSDVVFGTTERESLSDIWSGTKARCFRSQVAAGEYPSSACAQCHQDGKATTLAKDFDALLTIHWETYEDACRGAGILPNEKLQVAIEELAQVVKNRELNESSARTCRRFIFTAAACRRDAISHAAKMALRKLCRVARVCLDYFERCERPKVVGTLREVNIVAVCNASCIHCIGFHTQEISHGVDVGGRRYKRMRSDQIGQAFDRPRDMSLFYMNGSEFLLHDGWRELVEDFSRNRVLLALATNGMLLDESASGHLISHAVLRDVNFSFDGARRETVEAIRQNVRYDVLMNNVRAFLRVLQDSPLRSVLTVCLSMVLLKANIREAPELVRLADSLRRGRELSLVISFQVLNASDDPSYRAFYERERMDVDNPVGRAYLERAALVGEALGVSTYYSYTGALQRALQHGALRSPVGSRSESRALGLSIKPTTSDSASTGITLVSPSGYRLEGLSATDAAALLRALG